jgi:hypothetical protein
VDHQTVREMSNKTTIIDAGKARRVLGWSPKHQPLLDQAHILYAAWKAKFVPPASSASSSAAASSSAPAAVAAVTTAASSSASGSAAASAAASASSSAAAVKK